VVFSLLVVTLANHGRGSTSTPVKQGSGEIFRQPIAAPGPNAFTASVSKAPATTSEHTRATPSPEVSSPSPSPSDSSSVPVSSVVADTPGLYGGTRNLSTCDSTQLVTFLRENPSKASAWVRAINSDRSLSWSGGSSVRVDQIGQFVSELTPVLLRSDTRVTNHGFANGGPDPYQSVLEAGTAVLVDRYGIPRVRCACGNPLIPPVPVSTTPTYTGTSWQGFSPTTVVVVQPPPVIITTIVIVDVDTGGYLGRRPGTTQDTPLPTPSSPSASPSPTSSPQPSSSPSPGDVIGGYAITVTADCFGSRSVPVTLTLQVTGTTVTVTIGANGQTISATGIYSPSDSSFTAEAPSSAGGGHIDGRVSGTEVSGTIRDTIAANCKGTYTGHKM
jgi:hypothetical protein